MLKTKELPRLTNFLRAYCDVSAPWATQIEDDPNDLVKKRKEIHERQARMYSLKVVKKFLSDNSSLSEDEIKKFICELLDLVKQLVGSDATTHEIEGYAIFLIEAFRGSDSISYKQTKELQRMFGNYSYSTAENAFQIVRKVVNSLNDNISHKFIESGFPKVGEDHLEKEEFGSRLKFNDSKSLEKEFYIFPFNFGDCDNKKSNFDKLSFQFKQPDAKRKLPVKPVVEQERKYNHVWLKAEMKKSYPESDMGSVPIDVLYDNIISILRTERTNSELENELFDLLGFERYELIQTIFTNRKSLVSSNVFKNSLDTSSMKTNQENNPPHLCQVTIQSETEKQLSKQLRKDEKKIQKQTFTDEVPSFDPKYLKAMRESQLLQARNAPLFSNPDQYVPLRQQYPNVYDSFTQVHMSASFISGQKVHLPEGHSRVNNNMFEEINIPAVRRFGRGVGSELVPIDALDSVGREAFQGLESLNLIQSKVFNTAYNTNENMLVCAPTGAGKTNVALLTVIHEIKNNIVGNQIKKDKFKIVYVAPMKALASEMVRNFSLRLKNLGIQVKELTGDMQLTKMEIMQTQMLVTTPEKWDVVTRKSTGDIALTQLVKLLILDEVHLLDGDRGPVLEALVARTLRQVETSQSMIRILGLSATLPNYLDVARFLRVNPKVGLFFFDDRFRPVPLSTTFIGVKSVGATQQMKDMNEVCYMKILKLVQAKHQVMVFVHARNATVNSAKEFVNLAREKGHSHLFTDRSEPKEFGTAQKQMAKSRNKELREMFEYGFAIHHAGMLRMDRNYVEKYFRDGFIKVLVCTATLAWGVNLPARAVIIKGTDIYDSKHGTYVSLGVLDVMQIFGRAGRPQYDTEGHGTIITLHNKLNHYLSLLTRQHQIESNFENNLADNLNAEVTLGTVTNIDEGVDWLSYTYLYIRMMSNPHAYGLKPSAVENDFQLLNHRKSLIINAANKLDQARMVRYDERTGYLFITDLGRTASHYYISYDTVMRFQELLNQTYMNDNEILYLISNAKEFDQLKVRDDETIELDRLLQECVVPVRGGVENREGKINILLQMYLSRAQLNSFSLISDQAYIIQNTTRIIRYLFESALRNNWALRAASFLRIAKMFEKQQWSFKTPLRQFPEMGRDTVEKIDKLNLDLDHLIDMDVEEIGIRTRCPRDRKLIKRCIELIPNLIVEPTVQPITDRILRLTLHIKPDFIWDNRVHGTGSEAFWIWVEDPDSDYIYHFEYFLIKKNQVMSEDIQLLVFTIPLARDVYPSQYLVRVISDRWLGSDRTFPVDFQKLILPHHYQPQTELLELTPLSLEALHNKEYQSLYKFAYFNPIQTQVFHSAYHSEENILLGAPTGSGKTIIAEIAMFRVFNIHPNMKIVYIAPLKALVRERIEDWKVRFGQKLNKNVIELTGDVTPDARAVATADIIVTTPEKWDGISRSWQTRNYVKAIALMVIDEIHLLGESRGPVLEVIVSRTNFISTHTEKKVRIIGLSTALANAQDLASWLHIGPSGLFNFKPSVRPVPLEVHVNGYPGKHYCPRMALMNKPTYQAIQTHSPDKPALIFVSSRRQTRLTALDLIAYLAAENNPREWLHMPEPEIETYIGIVNDQNLKLTIAFGIGLHHAGLHERDRKLVETLFLDQKIQVLIATSTLAWGVNLPAHLVVIKGTEYFDGKVQRYVDFPITDVLQMMGRAGRPQFDTQGVAVVLVQDIKKDFYKKFLYDPFPVESSLIGVLPDHFNAEIVSGTINTKQQCMDYITWTYFFRRLIRNPGYYGLENIDPSIVNIFLSGLVNRCLKILCEANCLKMEDDVQLESTILGRIASFYYLTYKTIAVLKNHLARTVDMDKVLWILCEASEYDELPVRHNEDALNEGLAKECPIELNIHTYDSPHTKANLLIQAHFSRLKLPCADYYTDLKSVLDQAIRIIQGMIDAASDSGWLATTISCMILLQMILQARWYNDSTLLTLPHIEPHQLGRFCFLRDVVTSDTKKTRKEWHTVHSLPEMINECKGRRELLETILGDEFSMSEVNEIFQTLTSLPSIRINCCVKGWMNGQSEQEKVIKPFRMSGPVPESQYIRLHADQQYNLIVDLARLNKRHRNDNKALAPNFPKPKDEGWFLVLGIVDTGELVAMKRVPFVNRNSKQQISFYTPDVQGCVAYTVYLISDCYLGLDQQLSFYVEVIEEIDAKNRGSQSDSSDNESNLSSDDDEKYETA